MILLIIGDDELFQEMVQLALNAPTVMVAGTMRQGLDMMLLQRPDYIVLDLGVPESIAKETMEMIPKLKAASGGASLTVVTGYRTPEIEQRARECGADHFLPKEPGDEFVRNLAAQYSKVEPCASRETVEEIEKRVAMMTGSHVPFAVQLSKKIAKSVVSMLSEDQEKG